MKTKRLIGILVFSLGLTLGLLAGLQMAQATPAAANLFVKPDGTSTTCDRLDPCSIQTALEQAANGDSIYAARGDYTGKGTDVISVTKSVTLYGGWNGQAIGPILRDPARFPSVLDGERKRRVVRISENITPTLDGFTIANGNATGLIADCDENRPDGCGGGIFVHDAHPIIVNNVITNNVAAVTTAGYPTGTTGYGGGLYMSGAARAVISGNLIISNAAGLANCGSGGGMHLDRYSTISGAQVQFNQVLSNTATTTNLGCAWGGGIAGGPDGVVIRSNSITGNRANGYGGGQGAGLYQWYGTATYLNNLVSGNLGNASSQAVYLGYSRAHFEGNRVLDNATFQGVLLVNGSGGGPTLVNNVVARSGDRAFAATGHVSAPLTASLLHNTLIGSGTSSGVYIETDSVTLFMTDTIVVSHTWGITNTFPASSAVSADHTLFWANTDDGIRGASPVDGNPVFAADGYHVLLGSAAIDTGVNAGVTTDMDGETRPNGPGYDIGADEAQLQRVYLPVVMRN
jgi:hypothetical protein